MSVPVRNLLDTTPSQSSTYEKDYTTKLRGERIKYLLSETQLKQVFTQHN